MGLPSRWNLTTGGSKEQEAEGGLWIIRAVLPFLSLHAGWFMLRQETPLFLFISFTG